MKKQIINYEGLYQIDELGNIYSEPRNGTKGGLISWFKGQYYKVTLHKNNLHKGFLLHKLLAIHFIPNPNNYNQVNHIDGNKYNNDLSNLEWCNNSMNQLHAYKTGLRNPLHGSKNGNSKLKESDILEIRKIASESGRYYGRKKLAEKYNVCESHIKDIVSKRRNNWKYVH